MECSLLGAHLYKHGVIDSPKCECGFSNEDSLHYFLVCPRFVTQRAALHAVFVKYTSFTLYNILYGVKEAHFNIRKELYLSVHDYIENTGRFRRNVNHNE